MSLRPPIIKEGPGAEANAPDAGRLNPRSGVPTVVQPANRKPILGRLKEFGFAQSNHVLQAFGLSPKLYALTVAPIDEAERQLDLIAAYAHANPCEFRLALVGDIDHDAQYAKMVAETARATKGVVLLGRQRGNVLADLYRHAGVFVSTSSLRNGSTAALEAASHALPAILSDINVHREITFPSARYFAVGDIAGLEKHLSDVFVTLSHKHLRDEKPTKNRTVY